MIKSMTLAIAAAASLAVAGCDTLTEDQATVAGVAGGAAGGLILADIFGADKDWKLISALAGAAAGTLVAQNLRTNECLYARGDGTYVRRPCR